MKKAVGFIVSIILSTAVFSQPCFPEGITFSSQTEIDDFQFLNPDCTQIGGDLIISGGDISNVDSLISIISVGGDLEIRYNNNLSSLEGLSNISFLGGSLAISSNNTLNSLTGLEGIEEVFGDCQIIYMQGITNLDGLNGIKSIHGYFSIVENYFLTDLSGIDSLHSIGGFMHIHLNHRLKNLNGLERINSIGDWCAIQDNNRLDNIDALSSLTSINDNLAIIENDSLISISGIENIAANSITDLFIYNNYMLSACAVQSICDYLASPSGITDIYSNASGCNSQAEVELNCQIISVPEFSTQNRLKLFPNPAINHINIESEYTIKQIKIYRITGELVHIEKLHTRNYQMETTNMLSGVYQLKIYTDFDIKSERMIIL